MHKPFTKRSKVSLRALQGVLIVARAAHAGLAHAQAATEVAPQQPVSEAQPSGSPTPLPAPPLPAPPVPAPPVPAPPVPAPPAPVAPVPVAPAPASPVTLRTVAPSALISDDTTGRDRTLGLRSASVEAKTAIAEGSASGMEEARKTWEAARKLMGGEHVVLTATAYASVSCDSGQRNFLEDACTAGPATGGVAGVVSVPLWGAGGGHGSDWFPVLHTEAETIAFEKFKSRVEDYVNAVGALTNERGLLEVTPEAAARLRTELLRAADDLTRRADEDDASYFEVARMARVCVQKLLDEPDPAGKERLPANLAVVASQASSLPNECKDALTAAPEAVAQLPKRLLHAVQTLRNYLNVVTKEGPIQRHTFLVGPAVGFPITEDPTDSMLWGVAAELGWRDSFRMGFGAGFVLLYDAPLAPTSGIYVGVSLSGQIGDDLVHFLGRAAD